MRIGILGGTFNPVHNGHLILAEEISFKLKLDRVVFIPTFIPPHKSRQGIIEAKDRYNMIKLAIRNNLKFSIFDIEIKAKAKSYTVETLNKLKSEVYNKDKLFFITGSDSLKELSSWKDLDKIFKLAKFVIVRRPEYPLKSPPKEAICLDITQIGISSSLIRNRIKNKKSIRYLAPEKVREYIIKNNLYR